MRQVQKSLTLSRHSFVSFIAFGRSSRLHPVSLQHLYVRVKEHVAYEFVLTSPVLSCMSCSSYLDCFRDGRLVAVHLLFRRMLLPGFV